MIIFSGKIRKLRYRKRKGIAYYEFECKPDEGAPLNAIFKVDQIRKELNIKSGMEIVGMRLDLKTRGRK